MASYIDLNDLGSFANINALWSAYPEGGQEGDYCTIDGVKYRWDKYDRMWVADPNFGPTPARSLTTFDGDVNMQNNLTVAGYIRAKGIKQPCLGLFATLTALQAKWPEPEVGMWALVGDSVSIASPADVYRCDTEGTWTATGGTAYIDGLEIDITTGIAGWVPISSTSQLPTDPTPDQQGRGYLLGTMLYVYVGTGGDTLSGKYHSAQLKGATGETGPQGPSGVHEDDVTIADNLTTNDPLQVLSAKQGVVLKEMIDSGGITGDADIVLETSGKISILNSQEQEVVRIDDAGIHSPTIREEFSPKYDCYIIPSYGQSLAIGTQGGSTTFATVEQYAYNESLTKTSISDMCQGIAEGFRLVKEANNIVLPNRTKIITFKEGTGGISVKNLSKGGSYGYTQLLAAITTAKQNCVANGLTCYVPCIAWTQGEEDMRCGGDASKYGTTGFEPTEYHNSLIALIESLNKDIKAITGQTEDVVFVTYQTSSHTSYKRYPRIAMEQGLADDLSDKVYLVKPNYNVEYKREGSSSDPGTQGLDGFEVHCPNKSYREMGNHYGIAAAEMVLLGKRPSRMYPKTFHLSGTTMVIRFNVPVYPLVLDTTNVSNLADGNYGFCVYDVTEGVGETGTIAKATTEITSVQVTDIDEITITFSRTPQEGEVLTYGVNGDYWVNIDGVSTSRTDYEVDDGVTKAGNTHGSRGCVRDSASLVNNNTGAVYNNMYNWCRIFEYQF